MRATILSALMEEIRERILNATIRVYAEAGFRGATTRRVAQEAGVNEITLFRHFGTKEALIKAALKASGRGIQSAPPEPRAPESELYVWALATYRHWYENRRLINQVMGDLAEHPELAPDICEEPSCEHAMLSRYLERLRELGMTSQPFHADAAAGLLLGSVFTHALWRDHFEKPGLPPVEEVIRQYVALLLAALGIRGPAEAARGKK
jgi:AcrR family transcriptional regulator